MITQGKRIFDKTRDALDRLQPGEYMLLDDPSGDYPSAWFCACPGSMPDGSVILGALAKHKVTEHEDGTITVSPSILVSSPWAGNPYVEHYHGFLERGVWRTA